VTIIYFILGALWYSPLLFGKIWADAMNFKMDELEPKPKMFIGAGISAFITTLFLAILLDLIGTYNIITGLLVSLIVGIGFILTIGLYDVLYEDKNFKAYIIDAGYHIVALLIAGVILGLWVV
jgi:hypothetical protein